MEELKFQVGEKVVIKGKDVIGTIQNRKYEYMQNENFSSVNKTYFVNLGVNKKEWFTEDKLELHLELPEGFDQGLTELMIDVNLKDNPEMAKKWFDNLK